MQVMLKMVRRENASVSEHGSVIFILISGCAVYTIVRDRLCCSIVFKLRVIRFTVKMDRLTRGGGLEEDRLLKLFLIHRDDDQGEIIPKTSVAESDHFFLDSAE